MPVLYSDPYKDNPYGKLKGDKKDAFFKISFDEGKFYQTDDGYILTAFCTSFDGITRSYKPELGIEHGLCEIPFYNTEYELAYKKDGNYVTSKHQPSTFEKAICAYLDKYIDTYQSDGKVLTGLIGHLPDDMCSNLTSETLEVFLNQNVVIEPIQPLGFLKPWTPPKSKASYSGKGGYSKGASMTEKLAFIKQELCDSIKLGSPTEDESLAELTMRFKNEHAQDAAFLSIYFDMLMAIIR